MKKLIDAYTDFIFLEDPMEKADVIFLPGSEEGVLAEKAAALFHKGYAPYLCVSGKYAKGTGRCVAEGYETECDYFLEILKKAGVPKEALICEREATFTYENAV